MIPFGLIGCLVSFSKSSIEDVCDLLDYLLTDTSLSLKYKG